MKTRTHIPLLTLVGLAMMSCTSGLQVGSTSSWNDEIYGTTSKPKTQQVAQAETPEYQPAKKVDSNLDQLDQKYADVLEVNMDSIKNDTVIYKAEETNPYQRILSDSYQESYERRLRGLEDPWYGINDRYYRYSDNYWYAQAYDPYFYNTVVMGNQVWVEPWYISSMFGWPRTYVSFAVGFGWNYSYWNYNPGYWGWNSPYHNYYGYTPWYSNSPYWWGWNDGYYHGIQHDNSNYYYGRRTVGTTHNTLTRRNTTGINPTDGQITTTRRRGDNTITNPIESTRRSQTRIAPNTSNTRERRTSGSITNRGENPTTNTYRTRTGERPTRNIGVSEPTRRTYNTTHDRSRVTRSSGNTRRTDGSGGTVTRQPNTTTRGSSTPTYNTPRRVSTPPAGSTNTRVRSNNNSNSSRGSYRPSNSSSSTSTTRSNSGSSTHTNSGSNTRRR